MTTGSHMLIGLASLAWLLPLALYDLRHREVPHMGWVGVPVALAGAWAVWRGDGGLALLAGLAVIASERQRLPRGLRLILLVSVTVVAPVLAIRDVEALPGALAILGYWIAFEAGWWAGADALVAIGVALLWPDVAMLLAMAIAHLGMALLYRRRPGRPRVLGTDELEARGVPGLPALALAAAMRIAWGFMP